MEFFSRAGQEPAQREFAKYIFTHCLWEEKSCLFVMRLDTHVVGLTSIIRLVVAERVGWCVWKWLFSLKIY